MTTSKGPELPCGQLEGVEGRTQWAWEALSGPGTQFYCSLESLVCLLFAHGNQDFSFSHHRFAGRLGCGHE